MDSDLPAIPTQVQQAIHGEMGVNGALIKRPELTRQDSHLAVAQDPNSYLPSSRKRKESKGVAVAEHAAASPHKPGEGAKSGQGGGGSRRVGRGSELAGRIACVALNLVCVGCNDSNLKNRLESDYLSFVGFIPDI